MKLKNLKYNPANSIAKIERNYIFGKYYEKPAKPLVETILQVLKILRL